MTNFRKVGDNQKRSAMFRMFRVFLDFFVGRSKWLSRKGIYRFLDGQFQDIDEGAEVLSIGAGGQVNRRLLEVSKKRGFTVATFDIDPDRKPDLLGDVCTFDFGRRQFDVIVASEVFEHFHSPHLALKNLDGALRSGGTMVVTVPFIFPIHEAPYDYYRYTRYGLEYMFRSFESVNIVARNSWAESINVLFTRLIMEKSVPAIAVAPFFIAAAYLFLPFAWCLGKLLKLEFLTTGYLLTARKEGSAVGAQ